MLCVLRGGCHCALGPALHSGVAALAPPPASCIVPPLFAAAAQVGNRWEEFSQEEHTQLATLAYNMLKQGKAAPLPAAVAAGCLAAARPAAVALLPPLRSPLLMLTASAACAAADDALVLRPLLAPPTCADCAGAASWAIRSKSSLLLALVIKRSGPELWEAALPQLLQAAAAEGPAMQEQVGGGALAPGARTCGFARV